MQSVFVLYAVIGALALFGLFCCLRRMFWVTLVLTLCLAAFMLQDHPIAPGNLLYWLGAIVVLMLCAVLARAMPQPSTMAKPQRPSGPKPDQREVIIDGTNVMYWEDNTASLSTLRRVVDYLQKRDILPYVFLDASSRHHLGDTSLNERKFAEKLGLHASRVMVCPAKAEADVFILKFARQEKLPILSNDRFGDRAKQVKGLRLIKGVMAGGKPLLDGL